MSSISYREKFMVGGHHCGIEDYEEPGNHFMPGQPHERFKIWFGGCGIGDADTISEARHLLHTYLVSQVNAEYHGYQERMVRAQNTLTKLGSDPFCLAKFQVLPEAV